MKRTLTLLAVAALVAAFGASTGRAATVTVSVVGCYYENGGNVTVPAGSDVVFRLGWAESNTGRLKNFLKWQTTTASVDNVAVANASSLWGPIQKLDKKFYASFWTVSGGTLANPGDTTHIDMQVSLAHQVAEGKDPETGEHFKAGPGPLFPNDFGCTVTAT